MWGSGGNSLTLCLCKTNPARPIGAEIIIICTVLLFQLHSGAIMIQYLQTLCLLLYTPAFQLSIHFYIIYGVQHEGGFMTFFSGICVALKTLIFNLNYIDFKTTVSYKQNNLKLLIL